MIVQKLRAFGRIFRVRAEGNNAEFWISQVFVLAATVLGVYLASMEGFKLAVQFDRLSTQKDSYYMQSSLYDELQDNVVTAEKLVERIDQRNGSVKGFISEYEFSYFVWDSLKGQDVTFQIPSDVLNDIRKYYFVNSQLREGMQSSWAYDAKQARDAFETKTNALKTETLPALEANIQKLEQALAEHNFIEVE